MVISVDIYMILSIDIYTMSIDIFMMSVDIFMIL